MKLGLVLAVLMFVCSTATNADTQPKTQMDDKECTRQLDTLIQSLEAKAPTTGVEGNVDKVTIRIVRKIQAEEGSCAAFQAITKQYESNDVFKKDEQKQ